MREPYFETDSGSLYQGHVLDILKELPEKSIQCCVTSPPYWGLRDYGSAGQIGLEKTPEEYVATMVNVFSEVKRVLKDDGVLWLNLGDTYAANRSYQVPDNKYKDVGNNMAMNVTKGESNDTLHILHNRKPMLSNRFDNSDTKPNTLKPKDLIGIPWRVAFALQADGWYLRQDIIWNKPNPMPESVTDRCTKAHEYIFLLSKSAKYFYDHVAIREDGPTYTRKASGYNGFKSTHTGNNQKGGFADKDTTTTGRNKRSVWTISTHPYKEAHFATFPEKLIEPCALAGSRPGDAILDPFFGAGTTGVVAYKHGRKFVGIELNPDYCEIAAKRIEHETEQFKLFA